MNESLLMSIQGNGDQNTADPKKAKLESESLSLHPTTQKEKSFVKMCVENNCIDVSYNHRRELINYTKSG